MPRIRLQRCDLCGSEIREDPPLAWSYSTASVGHCRCQAWSRAARSAPWVSETEEAEAEDLFDRSRYVTVRAPFAGLFPDQGEVYFTGFVKVVSEAAGAKWRTGSYPSSATCEFVLAVCRRTSDWWPSRCASIRDDQVAGLLAPTESDGSGVPDEVLEDLVPGFRRGGRMPRSAAVKRLHRRVKRMLTELDERARSAA